jgi:hypothetical protein
MGMAVTKSNDSNAINAPQQPSKQGRQRKRPTKKQIAAEAALAAS